MENETNNQNYLMIPIKNEQLKDFITGLLGEPEEIEREIEGDFVITLNNLNDIFHLINERITIQNQGRLVSFGATIYLTNGKSVTFKSIESLNNYHELENSKSTNFLLTFNYLVQFSNRTIPEKQTISIGYIYKTARSDSKTPLIFSPIDSILIIKKGIKFSIKYTERSWAVDIDSLLEKHINSIKLQLSSTDIFFNKLVNIILPLVSIGVFGFVMYLTSQLVNYFSRDIYALLSDIKSYTNSDTFNAIIYKLDKLADFFLLLQYNFYPIMYLIGFFVSFFTSLTFYILSLNILITKNRTFIALTKRAIEEKKEYDKKEKNKPYLKIGYLISTIIVGILINYLSKIFFEN